MSFTDGDVLINDISNNIVTLNNNVQKLEDCIEKIGTSEENERLNDFINDLLHDSNNLSGKTNNLMKQLNNLKEFRTHKERLMNEYLAILRRLQDVQRTAVEKEKEKIKNISVQDHLLSNQSPPEQDIVRVQLQQQHKQYLLEVRERQQALVGFESDIQQLNEIFTDLARIVHEQTDLVDSIEANVEHASIYVEQGAGNVRQALDYQTKAQMSTLKEQYRIQMSNVLAKSTVQDILHHSLLKQLHMESCPRKLSDSSTSTVISSASSDSFFLGGPDPDLPSNDQIFTAKAKSKNTFPQRSNSSNNFFKRPNSSNDFVERSKSFRENEINLWLDWDTPPTPTLKLIKNIQRYDFSAPGSRRRNAIANNLQKSVSFPKVEMIRWPQARFFNPEVGREKLIELIEKIWNYSPILTYTVELTSVTGHFSSKRYRYVARWVSPSGNVGYVYFNIDVPRTDSERIVTVTYTFENGKIVHKPHTSNYHNRWLREFVQS